MTCCCWCMVWWSIVYAQLDTSHFCSAKNGTFGTLQMLLTQEVDVVVGPLCSSGNRNNTYLQCAPFNRNMSFYSSESDEGRLGINKSPQISVDNSIRHRTTEYTDGWWLSSLKPSAFGLHKILGAWDSIRPRSRSLLGSCQPPAAIMSRIRSRLSFARQV